MNDYESLNRTKVGMQRSRGLYPVVAPAGREPKAAAELSGPNSGRFDLEQPLRFGHAPTTRKSKLL
jgi:hypothetical protein